MTARVIPENDPALVLQPYSEVMAMRAQLREHGDLGLAGALALAMCFELAIRGVAQPLVAIPCALFGCLALALRRRLPLVAVVLTSAGFFGLIRTEPTWNQYSVVFGAVLLIALYSLGAHAPGYVVWLGALIVLLGVVLLLLNDFDIGSPGIVVVGTAIIGGPWAVGLAVRLQRDYELSLADENRVLKSELEERSRLAVAEERARIARELHDVVSHAISITVLQARGGRKMLGVDNTEVLHALDAIEHTNAQALSDMRRLLFLLREVDDDPGAGSPQPSLARMDSLIEKARASGLPVQLEITGTAGAATPGVDLSAYRIIQESLTNVLKHGGPSATASVTVRYGTDDLEVTIADTGVGGTAGEGRGHGLIGIRERVAVGGGQVAVGPLDAGGFVVKARLPYEAKA